jgi:arginine decarboxylase
MPTAALERWTIKHAMELYGIDGWGNGFFHINPDGEVAVRLPDGEHHQLVSLMDIIQGLKERGHGLPVLLRFRDLIDARLRRINDGFARVIKQYGYQGQYRGVFPIKVNQQQQVVDEIVAYGARYHHGLEAGSKAELMIALASLRDNQSLLVCNGYKDEEFIDLALFGQKLGLQVVLVVEMLSEVELIVERARVRGVRPLIGVRAKLSSRAGGRWNDSGGDRSVFGLSASDVIRVVDQLRAADMLDCLRMLHFHLGSQIPNIGNIRAAVSEAARFYVDLVGEGAPMGILDIGGGLAVDYDGSNTNFPSSRNYGLDEYCADVVEGVQTVLDAADIAHPTIVSESGRALVAHSSVLVFDILDVNRFETAQPPAELPDDAPDELGYLLEVFQGLKPKNLQESYHDALYYRDQLRSGFMHGQVSLRQRATGEQLFWAVMTRVDQETVKLKHVPEELRQIKNVLSDIYYGNFSVFQSLPDSWAIDQLFPVMPLHRLDQQPDRQATISDITCDCDGKIDRFIDPHDVRSTLPVHQMRSGEDYILGVFLVGAYQETLGDQHNLFGDTNVVSVRIAENDQIDYTDEVAGDSVRDVLDYVEYDVKVLVDNLRAKAEAAVREKAISPAERREIIEAYQAGMRGYTYFEA